MLVNFAWFRDATNPRISLAFPTLANVPIIGGTPIFELSVALLLIVGGLYWLGVQRHRSVPETNAAVPETGVATTVGGP